MTTAPSTPASRRPRFRRRIKFGRLAVLACLLAMALPALAQADEMRFWVSAEGTQTTTWNYPYFEHGGSCYGVPWSQSSGSEVIHFQTPRIKVLAVIFGKAVILHYGNWNFDEVSKIGLVGNGYIDREASESDGTKAGPCGGQTNSTQKRFDCGRHAMKFDVDAGWLSADSFQLLILPHSFVTGGYYQSCPVSYPSKDRATGKEFNVSPGQFALLQTAFPKTELLDRKIGKEIVLGKADYADWSDPGQIPFKGHTTIRWTITFTKAR